jgi:hypothetical protein
MFVASNPERHVGNKIGNGHCAEYCQAVTTGLPLTSEWRRGRQVRSGNVPVGTIIATFGEDGRYTNLTDGSAHAAVLIAENSDGLVVWDCWVGQPVQQRILRFRGGQGDAVNDGCQFYVVEVERIEP